MDNDLTTFKNDYSSFVQIFDHWGMYVYKLFCKIIIL